jgi:transcription elongation GreA/GreB family factor
MTENQASPTEANASLITVKGIKACLESPTPDWAKIGVALNAPELRTDPDFADLVETIQTRLGAEGQVAPSVALLKHRLAWSAAVPAVKPDLTAVLTPLFIKDPVTKRYVESIGIDKRDTSPAEALRRLEVLMALAPGVYCQDKTWGFGIVRSLDGFYGRVRIDFDGKTGHEMTFAYASSALQLVDSEHLLALRRLQPERLAAMVRDQPADLVKLTLKSLGSMPLPILQEWLVLKLKVVTDWKAFWDAARKGLKTDPQIEIPAKRSECLRLTNRQSRFDVSWVEAFRRERGMDVLLERLENLQECWDEQKSRPEVYEAVADRVRFIIRGSSERQSDLLARGLLMAHELGLDLVEMDPGRARALFLRPGIFRSALTKLPVRFHRPLIELVGGFDREAMTARVLEEVPEMSSPCLALVVEGLEGWGQGALIRERIKALTATRDTSPAVANWVARHWETIDEWSTIPMLELPEFLLELLSRRYAYDMLKAAHLAEEILMDKAWLMAVMGRMTSEQRQGVMQRLKHMAEGRNVIDVKGLMGRLIVLFPELNRVLSSTDETPTTTAARLTSWRSLKDRRYQLEKLVNEEIPANSRDIGVARSYGDLRENFEYKSAKEQQGLLMQRRAELEQDLAQARGTDFSGVPTDRVAPGTSVQIRYADGRVESHTLLGEWDQNSDLNIISSSSRLAQLLNGARVGDTVQVPNAREEMVPCTVESIEAPSEAIRAWMRG